MDHDGCSEWDVTFSTNNLVHLEQFASCCKVSVDLYSASSRTRLLRATGSRTLASPSASPSARYQPTLAQVKQTWMPGFASKTVTHPGTNWAWRRVTSLTQTNALLLSQTDTNWLYYFASLQCE